ncbi:hypothetical protein [Sphingomonas sp. 3P27F8]|uniref:hypothetical protein n=1 Tax=Sphingomonas sp. 3P27F8 TaxID=2502213 RepID=UPI0010F7E808|nr:hypothetical protein [Sphingomonas sp. 3P27F8]
MSDPRRSRDLWRSLQQKLDGWNPAWRDRVDTGSPRWRAGFPAKAARLPDEIVFESFAVALLSGNTRWDRIATIRGELGVPFVDFDPARFASLDDRDIDRRVLRWFVDRRAGSAGLPAGLLRLRGTAAILATAEGGAHGFLERVFDAAGGMPDQAAVLLGGSAQWKLPGFGIALAAEALRLLGFDLCKPDRHVLRAVGAWGLVRFARWPEKGAYTPPQARPAELIATMRAVRTLAENNAVGVSNCTSVIWLAGAVSGARLTNADFASLAAAERDAKPLG